MTGKAPQHGMSLIVRTVTRWLSSFILLFGVFMVLYGHHSPGGGFAGGVVIACAFILVRLAGGKPESAQTLPDITAETLGILGPILFLLVALAGMWLGEAFLDNFLLAEENPGGGGLLSGGTIQLCELAIGFAVSMSLFAAFAALSASDVSKEE